MHADFAPNHTCSETGRRTTRGKFAPVPSWYRRFKSTVGFDSLPSFTNFYTLDSMRDIGLRKCFEGALADDLPDEIGPCFLHVGRTEA